MFFYKSLIITFITLLFSYDALAFTNTINLMKPTNILIPNCNRNSNLHRRDIYGILSIIPSQFFLSKRANAISPKKEKTIDELRAEALNIIDIIEVQKKTITLPSLNTDNDKDTDKDNGKDNNNGDAEDNEEATFNVKVKTKMKIDRVLGNIMNGFTADGKDNPEKSVSNLQRYCSDTNIIKHKDTKGLTASFQDGKYALLLGKFISYEITDYQKNIDSNNSDDKNNVYYDVDMKVSAEYKTMLQNSIQFNDMYYPKNRDYNNICYVIYRWSLRKYEDGNLYLEGCYLVPPQLPN
jgi:hypothetical protein